MVQTHKKRTPLFGEKATTKSLVVMVRPVSVGRKARLSFFLSLSLSNEENDDDDDDARLNNNNNNALSLSKSFCFSLRTTHAREFIISSPTRSNTHSSSLSLSLSFKSHRARPRKDGQSLGDSTVRALDALVFYLPVLSPARARCVLESAPKSSGGSNAQRKRERIENF